MNIMEDMKRLKIINLWTIAGDRETWLKILREAMTQPRVLRWML